MAKSFYIKERHNGQTGVYYVGMGQLTKKDAKKREESLAGFNIIHECKTEELYKETLETLKAEGGRIHNN